MRSQLQGLAVFAVAWSATALALAAVQLFAVAQSRLIEITALVLANLLATVLRFVALRGWVFSPARPRPVSSLERSTS